MPVVTQITWAARQAGDVGLLHGSGLIADAIIAGENLAHEIAPGGFEASHAFVVANNAIFEAIWPKISLSPWTVYDPPAQTLLFRLAVDPALKQSALLALIHEYVGQGYNLTGAAIGMAGIEILRALDLPADINIFAGKQTEWCSELATRYIAKLMPDDENPATTDPAQIVNYLNALCAGVAPAVAKTGAGKPA